jgi:hypothetical protein
MPKSMHFPIFTSMRITKWLLKKFIIRGKSVVEIKEIYHYEYYQMGIQDHLGV